MDARGEAGVTLLEAYRALFPQWRKPREPEHPAHNRDDAEQVLKRQAKSGR